MYYTEFETPLCPIVLIGDEDGIRRLHMVVEDGHRELDKEAALVRDDALFEKAKGQILAYMKGDLEVFDLVLNPQGTEFQKKTWNALQQIPYGETRTYKEIAIAIGNEKASRAIGMANNKNPIPIIIPCHRVVGSNGKLTGFAFGLRIKDQLIQLENDYKS